MAWKRERKHYTRHPFSLDSWKTNIRRAYEIKCVDSDPCYSVFFFVVSDGFVVVCSIYVQVCVFVLWIFHNLASYHLDKHIANRTISTKIKCNNVERSQLRAGAKVHSNSKRMDRRCDAQRNIHFHFHCINYPSTLLYFCGVWTVFNPRLLRLIVQILEICAGALGCMSACVCVGEWVYLRTLNTLHSLEIN